ncbi:MAG: hypothetical protein ACYDBQ_02895 [Thermoplasmatota archaeon]
MTDELSALYLDNMPVKLLGDESRPRLERIVRAVGKKPDHIEVRLLTSAGDSTGRVVEAAEIIDRTLAPDRPIYLRSMPKPSPGKPPGPEPDDDPDHREPEEPAHPVRGAPPSRQTMLAVRQAEAEAEAEERQEEAREEEGVLQDDEEAFDDSDENEISGD